MQAATVIINRRAPRHNLQRLCRLAPTSKVVAVVKANAYGRGPLETARTPPDADASGVARLEEALRLRAGGITKLVLLPEGFSDTRDLPMVSARHPHTVVHNEEQLAALEEASLDEPVTVWMKLDTGMYRLSVRLEQAEAFYHRLTQCRNVRQPADIVSYFTHADEPKCGATEKRLVIFNTFYEDKPDQCSIAASGGILLQSQSHSDWVRPGIILYDASPLEDRSTGADFGCQPVMSLTSSLIVVREYKTGESVGYGGTWVNERDTCLGMAAMSYGDGYLHIVPSGTPMLMNGRGVPIIRRVAMDMTCVDLDPQAQDKAGGPVILWGEGLSVERTAEIAKVGAYEPVTRLTSKATMKYVD